MGSENTGPFKLWPHTPDGLTKMGYAVTVSPEHDMLNWWPMADAGQARNECEKSNRAWSAAGGPALLAEVVRLREALTPSADTKAAYIGEFQFDIMLTDDFGKERPHEVTVPWTTIKEIMAAIAARAALAPAKETT